MYFVRVEALKAELKKKSGSDRHALPYFLASFFVLNLALMAGSALRDGNSGEISVFFYLDLIVHNIIIVLGILWMFQCNNASGGRDFLNRVFPLSWVVGLRICIGVAIVSLLLFAAIHFSETLDEALLDWLYAHPEREALVVIMTSAVVSALFYWRVGVHLRSVANAEAADGEFEPAAV